MIVKTIGDEAPSHGKFIMLLSAVAFLFILTRQGVLPV